MTPKQIIDAIRGMRDRESLSDIINAAEARDSHLSSLESEDRRKRAWAKFSHLKRGDLVFVHEKPSGTNAWMYGEALRVREVKPRNKEIVVQINARFKGDKTAKLSALMCLAYKLSEDPTVAAFDNALGGDEVSSRKVKQ